jgi:hypothetical protein
VVLRKAVEEKEDMEEVKSFSDVVNLNTVRSYKTGCYLSTFN